MCSSSGAGEASIQIGIIRSRACLASNPLANSEGKGPQQLLLHQCLAKANEPDMLVADLFADCSSYHAEQNLHISSPMRKRRCLEYVRITIWILVLSVLLVKSIWRAVCEKRSHEVSQGDWADTATGQTRRVGSWGRTISQLSWGSQSSGSGKPRMGVLLEENILQTSCPVLPLHQDARSAPGASAPAVALRSFHASGRSATL